MKSWNKVTIEKQLSLHKQQNKDDRYNYMCEQFNALWYCWELEKYTINQNKQLNKQKEILDKIKEYAKEVLTWCTNDEITDEIANHILELLKEVL